MKKIVLITWIDAMGGDGWLSLQEIKSQKPCEHNSIGFLVHETDEFVTITMSSEVEEENMGAWLCIPRLYIKKVVTLVAAVEQN